MIFLEQLPVYRCYTDKDNDTVRLEGCGNVIAACTVAVDAEERKSAKYTALCDQYCFVPLAVETLGALGEEAATFFPRHWSPYCCRRWRAAIHSVSVRLFQRLSIAIQRGNAASVVGTASSDGCLDDVFYL